MDEDGIEIKPEPSSPGPSSRKGIDDEDEDVELQIKDMKPSVEVSYKGTHPYSGLFIQCLRLYRLL